MDGLRERKRRETRAALSRVTLALTLRKGWDNVTVEDIAAAANVSPRTFRNYFSTKAEAVAAGHLERMLRIADDLRARDRGEDLWSAITQAVSTQFAGTDRVSEVMPDHKRWLEGVRFLRTEPAIHGEILRANAIAQKELAAAIAERIRPKKDNDMYPELVAGVVISVVGVVLERWLSNDAKEPVGPLIRKAFELVKK